MPSSLTVLVEGGGDFWLHDAQPVELNEDAAGRHVRFGFRALDYANNTESVTMRLEYSDAELVGVVVGEIESVILDPRATILRSELDLSAHGVFEHRFSMWAPRYFEFAVRFSDAHLAVAPFPDT